MLSYTIKVKGQTQYYGGFCAAIDLYDRPVEAMYLVVIKRDFHRDLWWLQATMYLDNLKLMYNQFYPNEELDYRIFQEITL